MKSLVKKIWVLPLFGLMFFWGISMMAIPSKASSVSGHGLVAATKISPIKSLLNERDEAIVTIRGRVVKFKEHEALIIDDGTEQIAIEYQDKFKPLRLHVGETISVTGELNIDRSDYREILAQEIYNQNRRVYPQRNMTTTIREDQFPKTRYSATTPRTFSQENVLFVRDVLDNTAIGKAVTVEGSIIDLPEEELVLLRDSSGDVLVDIDDASEALSLRKGDRISVRAIVINGSNGKKELEAIQIRRL